MVKPWMKLDLTLKCEGIGHECVKACMPVGVECVMVLRVYNMNYYRCVYQIKGEWDVLPLYLNFS